MDHPIKKPPCKRKPWYLFVLLAAAILLLAGAYLALSQRADPPAPTPAPTAAALIHRETNDLRQATITLRGESPYTLTPTTNGYTATQAETTITPDKTAADTLVRQSLRLTAATPDIYAQDTDEADAYGLKDPAAQIALAYENSDAISLILGNQDPTGQGYYAQLQDDIYLISAESYAALAQPFSALHPLAFPLTFAQAADIRRLHVERAGEPAVTLRFLEDGEQAYSVTRIVLDDPVTFGAHGQRAIDLLDAVATLRPTAYAGEAASLPQAGLDAPRAVLTAENAAGESLALWIGAESEQGVYVRANDEQAVYWVDASALSFLSDVSVAWLINPFPQQIRIATVDALRIETGDARYELTVRHEGGREIGRWNGKDLSAEQLTALYEAIVSVQASGLIPRREEKPDATYAVFTFTLNVAPGTITVTYRPYDDDHALAYIDDEPMFPVRLDVLNPLLAQLRGV